MSIEQHKQVIMQLETLKQEKIMDRRNMFYSQFYTYEDQTLFNAYRRILIMHSIDSEIKEIDRIIDIEKNKIIKKQSLIKDNTNLDLVSIYATDNIIDDWIM